MSNLRKLLPLFYVPLLFATACVKYAIEKPKVSNNDVLTIYSATAITNCTLSGTNNTTLVKKFGQCWSSANDVPDIKINQGKTEFTENKDGDYMSVLTNLSPRTTYYIRAYLIIDKDTLYDKRITSFTSKDTIIPQPPNVATLDANTITPVSFNIEGKVVSIGTSNITAYGHCYSNTNQTPTIADAKTNLGTLNAPLQYTSQINSLTSNTAYYVRAYATNAVGTTYGTVLTVNTPSPTPTITSISPTNGVAGTEVTITGTNFDATATNNTVKFNSATTTVTNATTTQLKVKAPTNGTTGAVTVTTSAGTATGPIFSYLLAPVITSISPNSGLAGTTVKIFGANFEATLANNIVKFNGVNATVLNKYYDYLEVIAPLNSSTGNVTVTTAGGTSNGVTYTYEEIYLAGANASGVNGYWKGSTFYPLPDCAKAKAIFVSGTNIYVCGKAQANGEAALWKNGSLVYLSGGNEGMAESILVSGSDEYVVGYELVRGQSIGISSKARLWKNGIPQFLFGNNSSGTGLETKGTARDIGIFNGGFYNGRIYIVGNLLLETSNTQIIGNYWYVGNTGNVPPLYLSNGENCVFTSVFMYNDNFYICGTDTISDPSNAPNRYYWKNGLPVSLAVPLTPINKEYDCTGIAVTLTEDVYISGQFNGKATYWKNGTMFTLLPSSFNSSSATGVLTVGNDVYISATVENTDSGYWKNGIWFPIAGAKEINGIFIK